MGRHDTDDQNVPSSHRPPGDLAALGRHGKLKPTEISSTFATPGLREFANPESRHAVEMAAVAGDDLVAPQERGARDQKIGGGKPLSARAQPGIDLGEDAQESAA